MANHKLNGWWAGVLPLILVAASAQPAAASLTVVTTAINDGVDGTLYQAQQLVSSGGTGTVTWKLATGYSLVKGLALSTSGLVSGTPTTATDGVAFFDVVATDSAKPAHTAAGRIGYVINPSNNGFKVTTLYFSFGIVNQKFSGQLASTGGTGTVTWSLVSAAGASGLPPGVKLASSGLISGTPTAAGSFNFWVKAADSTKPTAKTVDAFLTIIVQPSQSEEPLSIDTFVLPAYEDASYTGQLSAYGGKKPYDWSLVGSESLPAGLHFSSTGAITGKPTGTAPTFSFAVKVTDSSSPKQTATATLSLPVYAAVAKCTPAGSSAQTQAWLKGPYALLLDQIDMTGSGDPSWVVASFIADGSGHLTGGLYDANGPSYDGENNGPFTGTYAIGSNGRGYITISATEGGKTATLDFCVALSALSGGVAGGGQLVEADETYTVAHGVMFAQGGSNYSEASVKGGWAFGLQGGKLSDSGILARQALAGYLDLDGKGNVAGELDFSYDQVESSNDLENQYLPKVSVAGSYTLAASGRGTMNITISSGGKSEPVKLVFYVAGPSQLIILDSDIGYASSTNGDENHGIVVGKAWKRASTTFSNATLSGTTLFVANGVTFNGSSAEPEPKFEAGFVSVNGAGKLSATFDENSAGSFDTGNSVSASYSVDANGRVTIGGGSGAPVFYLSGTNQGFGVEADNSVEFSELLPQSVPPGGFTASSVNGSFAAGSIDYGFIGQTAYSGVVDLDSGTATGIFDTNSAGDVAVDQSSSVSYSAASTGRFVVSDHGKETMLLYFLSKSQAIGMGTTDDPWTTLSEYDAF